MVNLYALNLTIGLSPVPRSVPMIIFAEGEVEAQTQAMFKFNQNPTCSDFFNPTQFACLQAAISNDGIDETGMFLVENVVEVGQQDRQKLVDILSDMNPIGMMDDTPDSDTFLVKMAVTHDDVQFVIPLVGLGDDGFEAFRFALEQYTGNDKDDIRRSPFYDGMSYQDEFSEITYSLISTKLITNEEAMLVKKYLPLCAPIVASQASVEVFNAIINGRITMFNGRRHEVTIRRLIDYDVYGNCVCISAVIRDEVCEYIVTEKQLDTMVEVDSGVFVVTSITGDKVTFQKDFRSEGILNISIGEWHGKTQ